MELVGLEPATSWVRFRACSATTLHDTTASRMVEPNQGSGVMWRYAVLRGEMLTRRRGDQSRMTPELTHNLRP